MTINQKFLYVDRILKGEKPADLPMQAPTEYELVNDPKPPRRSNSSCFRFSRALMKQLNSDFVCCGASIRLWHETDRCPG